MFVVLLRFADRSRAGVWSKAHGEWLTRGFDDGVFLLSGSAHEEGGGEPIGGLIVASGADASEIRARVDADPFVAHGVVTASILDVAPSNADERLRFLMAGA